MLELSTCAPLERPELSKPDCRESWRSEHQRRVVGGAQGFPQGHRQRFVAARAQEMDPPALSLQKGAHLMAERASAEALQCRTNGRPRTSRGVRARFGRCLNSRPPCLSGGLCQQSVPCCQTLVGVNPLVSSITGQIRRRRPKRAEEEAILNSSMAALKWFDQWSVDLQTCMTLQHGTHSQPSGSHAGARVPLIQVGDIMEASRGTNTSKILLDSIRQRAGRVNKRDRVSDFTTEFLAQTSCHDLIHLRFHLELLMMLGGWNYSNILRAMNHAGACEEVQKSSRHPAERLKGTNQPLLSLTVTTASAAQRPLPPPWALRREHSCLRQTLAGF